MTIDYLLDDEEPTYITVDETRNLSDDTQNFLIRFRRLPIRSKKELLKVLQNLENQAGLAEDAQEIIPEKI